MHDSELDLAQRHAPIVYFDAAEPFVPQLVGYAVLRQPGPSPTFDRYLNLTLPNGRPASAVIEYALWTDWDIQHLYELEHVWSYVDDAGRLIFAEASWHGNYAPLLQNGRLSAEDERPIAYAQPGKHAMIASAEMFATFDFMRGWCARPTGLESGSSGLLVGTPIAGRIEKTPRRDALANAFLRRRAFTPTYRFDQCWDARDVPFLPCDDLVEQLPTRLEGVLSALESARANRRLWAILFDLGDTLMVEESEEKDETRTTQRADLFPGAVETIWQLRREGYLLGLVADTRPGTYRNVLRQHGIFSAFDVFAISEDLGCEKPDRRTFDHALVGLGLTLDEASRVAMVGNNLARDIRGANAGGLVSIWLRHNDRHPTTPADEAERPRHQASSFGELRELLRRIG